MAGRAGKLEDKDRSSAHTKSIQPTIKILRRPQILRIATEQNKKRKREEFYTDKKKGVAGGIPKQEAEAVAHTPSGHFYSNKVLKHVFQ